jgi:hypothetical protein
VVFRVTPMSVALRVTWQFSFENSKPYKVLNVQGKLIEGFYFFPEFSISGVVCDQPAMLQLENFVKFVEIFIQPTMLMHGKLPIRFI